LSSCPTPCDVKPSFNMSVYPTFPAPQRPLSLSSSSFPFLWSVLFADFLTPDFRFKFPVQSPCPQYGVWSGTGFGAKAPFLFFYPSFFRCLLSLFPLVVFGCRYGLILSPFFAPLRLPLGEEFYLLRKCCSPPSSDSHKRLTLFPAGLVFTRNRLALQPSARSAPHLRIEPWSFFARGQILLRDEFSL